MALLRKNMISFFAIVVVICGISKGEVYKVGDASGWTTIGHIDYKSWAASKNFEVGDTIVFEYNRQFHDVLRVSHENFNACNSTAPFSTWTSGNDSFVIQRPGHFYFICGFTGHCQAGLKVDIRVQKSDGPTQAPSPFTFGPYPQSSPTFGPSSESPIPSAHNSRSSSFCYSWKLLALVIASVLKAIAH